MVSPVLGPDAEDVPDELGASLSEIRHAFKSGDQRPHHRRRHHLSLVTDRDIIEADHPGRRRPPGRSGRAATPPPSAKRSTPPVDRAGTARRGRGPRVIGISSPRCSRVESRTGRRRLWGLRRDWHLLVYGPAARSTRRDLPSRSSCPLDTRTGRRRTMDSTTGGTVSASTASYGGRRQHVRHRQVDRAGPGRRRCHRGVRRHHGDTAGATAGGDPRAGGIAGGVALDVSGKGAERRGPRPAGGDRAGSGCTCDASSPASCSGVHFLDEPKRTSTRGVAVNLKRILFGCQAAGLVGRRRTGRGAG